MIQESTGQQQPAAEEKQNADERRVWPCAPLPVPPYKLPRAAGQAVGEKKEEALGGQAVAVAETAEQQKPGEAPPPASTGPERTSTQADRTGEPLVKTPTLEEAAAPAAGEAPEEPAAPPTEARGAVAAGRPSSRHPRAGDQPITGQQIREARQRLGLTQRELAERVGLSRPFIALVEQGRRVLSPEDLERVRQVLGL